MRDKNSNFIQFDKQVDEFLKRKLILPRLLRTAVIDSPTFLEQYYIVYPRDFKSLQGLIVVSYFLPEYLRWKIWLDLSDNSFSHLNERQRLINLLFLTSKEIMLLFLYLTKRYTSHEIFGNILNSGIRSLGNLKIYRKSQKVVFAKRKRGYDDKGSLRPKEKWLPDFDFTFTECQMKKEKKLILQQRTINRILRNLRTTLKSLMF